MANEKLSERMAFWQKRHGWPAVWIDIVAGLEAQLALSASLLAEQGDALHALEKERDELLARLAKAEVRSHLETIDERDRAEEAFSQAYFLITGNSPEWSNSFGFDQALMDIDDAQKCLRAEITSLSAHNAELIRAYEETIPHDSCCNTVLRLQAPDTYPDATCDCPKAERLARPKA